eukprot:Pgem_evm1s236
MNANIESAEAIFKEYLPEDKLKEVNRLLYGDMPSEILVNKDKNESVKYIFIYCFLNEPI